MTGREFMLYILKNNLENEPIIKDGKLIGSLTINEVATEFNVGRATVKTWIEVGLVDGFKVGNEIFILPTDKLRATREGRLGTRKES